MILPIRVYSSNFSSKAVQKQCNFVASSSSQKENTDKKHKQNVLLGIISLLGVGILSDILLEKWLDRKSKKGFKIIETDIEKTNAEWEKMDKELTSSLKDIEKSLKLETENVIKKRL